MKSLELVNEMLNYPFEERILTELATNETIIREEELKIIKQDLEVLEILKNKTKYMLEDGVDRFEIFSLDEKISKEDFKKVKQWLEENE